jgi:hypothetical protein
MRGIVLVLVLSAAVMVSGCAIGILTNVTEPSEVCATQALTSAKVGTSNYISVAGVVAIGDAGIEAACRNGGITKIHHLDINTFSVLGVFTRRTTYVYGE